MCLGPRTCIGKITFNRTQVKIVKTTQKLKLLQNSKTQNVAKLKNSKTYDKVGICSKGQNNVRKASNGTIL